MALSRRVRVALVGGVALVLGLGALVAYVLSHADDAHVYKWIDDSFDPDSGRRKKAHESLIVVLKTESSPVIRTMATRALSTAEWNDQNVVLALADALRDKDEDVRRAAALALLTIRPESEHVLRSLLEALDDSDYRVRGAATLALQANQAGLGEWAVVELEKKLDHSEEAIRRLVIHLIGNLGSTGAHAIPKLSAIANNREANEETRQAARHAICRIAEP